jgi:excisionase family DNA binding protein
MNIITVKELSKFLKISNSTIYKLASAGEIPAFRIGDSWRFDLDQIRGILEGDKPGAGRKGIQT